MGNTVINAQEESESSSIQAQIIRQMQISDGQTPCYATSASAQCNNRECSWRHDCFDEVRGAG